MLPLLEIYELAIVHSSSIFMSAFLFPNLNEVGEVHEVTEDVIIKPSRENSLQYIAISGRKLYNGDLIYSSENGKMIFSLPS